MLNEIRESSAPLRGNNAAAQGFQVVSPKSRVILETRPRLVWGALAGATSYQVFVSDAEGREVAASTELPPTQTSWQPAALPAGATYSWAVVALVEGKEVVAPGPAAPEARFHLVATDQARAINALGSQQSPSAALGILYAQVGLLAEAEQELKSFLQVHPHSAKARRLLRQLKAWH